VGAVPAPADARLGSATAARPVPARRRGVRRGTAPLSVRRGARGIRRRDRLLLPQRRARAAAGRAEEADVQRVVPDLDDVAVAELGVARRPPVQLPPLPPAA